MYKLQTLKLSEVPRNLANMLTIPRLERQACLINEAPSWLLTKRRQNIIHHILLKTYAAGICRNVLNYLSGDEENSSNHDEITHCTRHFIHGGNRHVGSPPQAVISTMGLQAAQRVLLHVRRSDNSPRVLTFATLCALLVQHCARVFPQPGTDVATWSHTMGDKHDNHENRHAPKREVGST